MLAALQDSNADLAGLYFFFKKSRICAKELAFPARVFPVSTSMGVICLTLSAHSYFRASLSSSFFRFFRFNSLLSRSSDDIVVCKHNDHHSGAVSSVLKGIDLSE